MVTGKSNDGRSSDDQNTLKLKPETSYIGQLGGHGDCTLIFAVKDKVGVLAELLSLFHGNKINLKHIESRSSHKLAGHYEFVVIFDGQNDASKLIEQLKRVTAYIEVISREPVAKQTTVPWFPLRMRDLDQFANHILMYGSDLDADHPGFTDPIYRERRDCFANIAKNYKHGTPIPRVEYTDQEIDTWRAIYRKVVPLHGQYACREYNHIFPLMEENCGYREDNIPQLEDVSRFLKDSSGFTLRPVAGLLSSRDFLAGLAYRVFHTTQYIRHHSNPQYTPEPDVCHELLGHAPLFADPHFARLSQEIGLASLGAPDEYVEKLATCYWFTIEFGLCKQDGETKAYGAGLLSSYGELQYSMSGKPQILPFNPAVTCSTEYPITQYQPKYFLADSFVDAQAKLHDYATTIPRPGVFRYNPYTESIELLNSKAQVRTLAKEIQNELSLVVDSLMQATLTTSG